MPCSLVGSGYCSLQCIIRTDPCFGLLLLNPCDTSFSTRNPLKGAAICSSISMGQSFAFVDKQTGQYRGPAPFHRLTPNKRFEPVFSTMIMAVCSLFNRMLLLTDLILVHLLYCGQPVMIGCNHTSFERTREVRHIYGIIRHMQGLYTMSPSISRQANKQHSPRQNRFVMPFIACLGIHTCMIRC